MKLYRHGMFRNHGRGDLAESVAVVSRTDDTIRLKVEGHLDDTTHVYNIELSPQELAQVVEEAVLSTLDASSDARRLVKPLREMLDSFLFRKTW
ncbi:MAG TPA: hypothetical protein VFH78_12260 [Candidatus Thermoplasmatota archaeon]|nr:hypothetical protein [Candidatus Thermoplasmatota archaeon]